MVACLALVLVFQESTALAAAYGIAVTGTMSITSVLFYRRARERWGWPLWKAGPCPASSSSFDLGVLRGQRGEDRATGGWLPAG
jgi:KUP system potassium uptake protein